MARRQHGPVVVGIDAGFAATGLVAVHIGPFSLCVVAVEVVRTQPSDRKRGVRVADDDAERATRLFEGTASFLQRMDADGAVVELPTGGAQGARANRAMGIATGAVCGAVRAASVPAEWVTPRAVKLAACGNAVATKEAVARACCALLDWKAVSAVVESLPTTVSEHLWDAAGAVLAARDGVLIGALRG